MSKIRSMGWAGALATVGLVWMLGLAPGVAQAQGVYTKEGLAMAGAKRCPDRWHQGSGTNGSRERQKYCYPSYANSPKVYRAKTGSCAAGYGLYDEQQWCVEGYKEPVALGAQHTFTKANKTDRCPAGFHSYKELCASDYDKPSTARLKGSGECRADEILEWGLWCTSNYAHLTAKQLRGAAIRDYNNIYGYTGKEPRQSPNSDESEVYAALFGQGAPATAEGASAESPTSQESAPSTECVAGEVGKAIGSLFGGSLGQVASQIPGCKN